MCVCFINPTKKCHKVAWHEAMSVSFSGARTARKGFMEVEAHTATFSERDFNRNRRDSGDRVESF